MDILNINHITKNYAAHVALDDVSITVPEQSVFGLLGPNGAGKTSLIRIVNQITAADRGEILFNGKPLERAHTELIGYMPEERGLYKKMEVGEQALYLAQLKGLSRQDATKKLRYWFEKFELQSWWKKKIEELSKGMQQKIQFIVTVIHEPKLLIMDEPFSGFDPINAILIRDEMLELKAKGSTIILSTHRMESVEALCTHIALINKSKKILDGSVKDIRKQYKLNVYEVVFEGNKIGFANALWTGFELHDTKEDDGLLRARVKMLNGNTPNQLLEALLPHVKIHSFVEVVPSMEDIFIMKVNEKGI